MLPAPLTARGEVKSWAAAASDNFENQPAWTDNSRPNSNGSDAALFSVAGSYNVWFSEFTNQVYRDIIFVNDLTVEIGAPSFLTIQTPRPVLYVNSQGGTKKILITNGGTLNLGSASDVDAAFAVSGNTIELTGTANLNVRLGSKAHSFGNVFVGSGTGTVLVNGNGSIFSGGIAKFGFSGGTATVTFSNAASGSFSGIQIADESDEMATGSTAVVNVLSGAHLDVGNLTLATIGGAAKAATLNLQDGGSTVTQFGTSTLTVGHSATGSGVINIGTSGSAAVFSTGTGLTTIKKMGAINVAGGLNYGTLNVNGNITIDGGVLATGFVGQVALAPNKTMTIQNGGRATFTGAFTTSNAIYNVTGAGSKLETLLFNLNIASGGTVNVNAGGLLSSAGAINVGTGTPGTLAVATGGNLVATGPLTIGSLGTLTGTGTIPGDVSNGGVVAPGSSAGALHVSGNYAQTSGGKLQIEIRGTTPVTGYDQLLISGGATLAGTLAIDLVGFTPAAGDSFNILDFTTHSGSFTTFQLPALPGSLQWNINQLFTAGVLSVFSNAGPGDFNGDYVVDAADYVVWRNDPNRTQAQYDTWRTNFGQYLGAGSAAGLSSSTVPEPAAWGLLTVVGCAVIVNSRRKSIPHNRV